MKFPNVNGLSVARAALEYTLAGIAIAPFDPKRGNGKQCGNLVGNPSDSTDRWYRHVTTDHCTIKAWRKRFGSFQALATSPGEFDCVVIDLDYPDLWPVRWRKYLKDQSVPYVNTRPSVHKRKGHYWFTLPHGCPAIANRSFAWGEVRCLGGGIVLPPYTNPDTGDARTVMRSGVIPPLPTEIYDFIAGSGVAVTESFDLQAFCGAYTAAKYPGKLKGLAGLYRYHLERSNPHEAMRKALRQGFSEAVVGFVAAQDVLQALGQLWPAERKRSEFVRLASWCAAVAQQSDLDEIEAISRRSKGSDSRRYSSAFRHGDAQLQLK